MKLNRILSIAAVFCTVLAVSCKKETPVPTGMTLDQTAVTVFVGQTATVTPTYTPSNAKATELVWTSSDEKVATVAGGYVKGIKAGTATITGKAQGSITATCSVTVKNVEPTKFVITPTEMTLIKNSDPGTITYVLEPKNVTFPTVTWKSSDDAVATVDQSGVVTPVGKGEAVITASLVGGMSATCKVSVINGPETLDMWKSDAAGSRELYGFTADEGKSAGEGGWLYWKSGNVYWKENTTGFHRIATLELSSGSKITVTQFDAKELAGDYSFTAKFFSNNSSIVSAGNNKTINITAEKLAKFETLTDCNGKTYEACLGLTGFYDTAVMQAGANINYDEKTIKFALLLDARKAQKVSKSNVKGYEYVCFLPEMGTGTGSSWAAPWNFVQADLDATNDFMWLEFDKTASGPEFTWNSFSQGQFMNGSLKTDANRVIGITCAVCKSEDATKANVYGTYNVIYQANTNSDTKVPVTIKKK